MKKFTLRIPLVELSILTPEVLKYSVKFSLLKARRGNEFLDHFVMPFVPLLLPLHWCRCCYSHNGEIYCFGTRDRELLVLCSSRQYVTFILGFSFHDNCL